MAALESRTKQRQRRQRRTLRTELLESRCMLDGQLASVLVETAPNSSPDDQPTADTVEQTSPLIGMTQSGQLGEQFGSSDAFLDWLLADAQQRWAPLFGREVWLDYPPPMFLQGGENYRSMHLDEAVLAPVDSLANATTGDEVAGSIGYDSTNIQVAGVDESDIVKTDGEYLYMLARGELIIVDARDPHQLTIASRTTVPDYPLNLFLHEDRLTLVSMVWSGRPVLGSPSLDVFGSPSLDVFGSPGLDVLLPPLMDDGLVVRDALWRIPEPVEPRIQVTVFDVADPTSPQSVQTSQLEGTLVDSRSIGSDVYLILQTGISLPEPRFACQEQDVDADETLPAPERIAWHWVPTLCSYETQQQYVERMEAEGLELVLPHVATAVAEEPAGDDMWLVQPEDIYRPITADALNLLSVVTIDVSAESPGSVSTTSLPSTWASQVYMTDGGIYVLSAQWERTGIVKFEIADSDRSVRPVATGQVAGRVLNQFGLDEFDGYLRVVVQEGWAAEQHTDLFVLQHSGDRLEVVGSVEGLAPGETLFSTRFEGELAYIVTFGVQGGLLFDPLFTINLSEPANPRVEGELVIPGFSDYLHSIGSGLILGVGRDVNPETGRRLAPQVSLFDVRELEDPQLVDRLELSQPGSASWTEAAGNHHAFNYFADQQILTVPVEIAGAWAWPTDETIVAERSGMWVVQVDVEAGQLHPLGKVEHDGPVRRSLRIGDVLFSISDDTVQSHPLLRPNEVLSEVRFQILAQDDWFSLDWNTSDVPLDILRNDSVPGGVPTLSDVTSLTAPDQGGSVRVSDDGRQLLYTPAEGFVGIERFRYTLSGLGGEDVGAVTVTVAPDEPQIAFDLRITDLAGNPLTRVEVGDDFLLNVYAQDVGQLGMGVFAAYLDVQYESELASALGGIQFGDAYRDATSGEVRPGLLDEVGAMSGFAPLGDGEALLFQLELTAERPGLLTFVSDSADQRPQHDLLLYNVNFEIPSDWAQYGQASLEVVGDAIEPGIELLYQNLQRPQDVNADGIVAPGDLLMVVNDLNQAGARPLARVASPSNAGVQSLQRVEGESVRPYFPDVNGDYHVSAADALVIINWLNNPLAASLAVRPQTIGEGEWQAALPTQSLRAVPPDLSAAMPGDLVTPELIRSDRIVPIPIASAAPSLIDSDGTLGAAEVPLSIPTSGRPATSSPMLGTGDGVEWPVGPLPWSDLEALLEALAADIAAI